MKVRFKNFLSGRKIYQNGYTALQPKVSVVMPTFCRNAEGLLDRCIQSVLGQTFRNFEFIIVDDGSTDGSQQLIETIASADPRIVYVRHDINSGLPAVRTNEGIMLARAQYIAFIFDDNIWTENCLEKLLTSMEAIPADVHYARTNTVIDESKQILFGEMPLTREFLQHLNTIPNGSILCTKAFFGKYGLYDPHVVIRRVCDWDLWLRAISLGAVFYQVDDTLSMEMGPSSPVSIGNSVQWDYKIAVAYITDEKRANQRSVALRPENIEGYDVFSPDVLLPYLRNFSEWINLENIVYKTYFSVHPSFSYEPLINHNRLTDPSFQQPVLATVPASIVWSSRKRILLVRNVFDEIISDWKTALEGNDDYIVLTCGEWQLGEFKPWEIDAVILFDCAGTSLHAQIMEFRAAKIPVGFVIYQGFSGGASDAKKWPLDYSEIAAIRSVFGESMYFPHSFVEWSPTQKSAAEELMQLASTVLYYDDRQEYAISRNVASKIKLEWIVKESQLREGCSKCDHVYIYCGNIPPSQVPEMLAKLQTIDKAKWARGFTIFVYPGDSAILIRNQLEGAVIVETWESLFYLRNQFNKGIILLPDELINAMGTGELSIIEECFSAKDIKMISFNHFFSNNVQDSANYVQTDRSDLCSIPFERPIAKLRSLYIQTLCQALFLHAKIATITQRPRCLVFINSTLLAGSEAYGLMVAKLLKRLGFEVEVCIPSVNYLGKDGDPVDVNAWLKAHGLTEAVVMPYDTHYFGERLFEVVSRHRIIELCKELKARNTALVICSGLMPEVAVSAHIENVPLVHALFQPTGCDIDLLTQFRDTTDGMISDSIWSAKWWGKWLAPPIHAVPSHVECANFKIHNQGVPLQPIRIAIGGTVQPRKRQLEALKALEPLVDEGHDLLINIYGYQLEIFSEYIAEMEQLIAKSVLHKRVTFHGLVDMETIVRDNHVILSASIDESLPQTFLYVMAAGLLPVACPAGGISELVQDGRTGFLAKGFGVEDIKAAMGNALKYRDDWPRIIEVGRSFIAENYSEIIAMNKLVTALYSGVAMAKTKGRDIARDLAFEIKQNKKNDFVLTRLFVAPAPANELIPSIGPDIISGKLRYFLCCDSDNLSGLRFFIGTYFTVPEGHLCLTFKSCESGEILWRMVFDDLTKLEDNAWYEFSFEAIKSSAGKKFELCVQGSLDKGRLAIYEFYDRSPAVITEKVDRFVREACNILKKDQPARALAFFPYYGKWTGGGQFPAACKTV